MKRRLDEHSIKSCEIAIHEYVQGKIIKGLGLYEKTEDFRFLLEIYSDRDIERILRSKDGLKELFKRYPEHYSYNDSGWSGYTRFKDHIIERLEKIFNQKSVFGKYKKAKYYLGLLQWVTSLSEAVRNLFMPAYKACKTNEEFKKRYPFFYQFSSDYWEGTTYQDTHEQITEGLKRALKEI